MHTIIYCTCVWKEIGCRLELGGHPTIITHLYGEKLYSYGGGPQYHYGIQHYSILIYLMCDVCMTTYVLKFLKAY